MVPQGVFAIQLKCSILRPILRLQDGKQQWENTARLRQGSNKYKISTRVKQKNVKGTSRVKQKTAKVLLRVNKVTLRVKSKIELGRSFYPEFF